MPDLELEKKVAGKPISRKVVICGVVFASVALAFIAVIALAVIIIALTSFLELQTVSGPSMQNTLYNGDLIVTSDFFYEPQYGDIVAISRDADKSEYDSEENGQPFIKRVIATEGQWVDIDFESGVVSVGSDLSNMTELDEPYVKTPTNKMYDVVFPLYVEDGYVFVLGDNRNESLDSRASCIGDGGLVEERLVLGKAIFRIWPFDAVGGLENY